MVNYLHYSSTQIHLYKLLEDSCMNGFSSLLFGASGIIHVKIYGVSRAPPLKSVVCPTAAKVLGNPSLNSSLLPAQIFTLFFMTLESLALDQETMSAGYLFRS